MNALHINGNELTLEAVREVAAERRPVLLSADAREAVDRARAVVDEIVASDKAGLCDYHGRGQAQRSSHCRRPDSRAASQPGAFTCRRRRRAALRRRNTRHDVTARQFPRQRMFRRARGCHRRAMRNAESRRHTVCSVARQRGREWRSGSVSASGTGSDRRRRVHRRRPARAFPAATRCSGRRSSPWCSKRRKPFP